MENNNLSRRGALKIGAAAVTLALPGGIVALARPAFASHSAPPRQLQIPPLYEGQLRDGIREYDLTVQAGKTEFFDGFETDSMGINGSYLGPVLRMTSGETVRLNVTNALKDKTTLHWHGFTLPARMDGGPHQEIKPGAVWSPEFLVREKASTMWYHSHLHNRTADQVWAGLAGMIIVDDDESLGLDLPATYGVDDIPAVLQDRSFRRNGQMPYDPGLHFRMVGMIGEIPMVNGTIAPFFNVTTSLIRLRILNGSNGSIYNLAFDDGRAFDQIASDGGLLAEPVPMRSLILSPGERAEIIVDMSDGRNVMLRSEASAGSGGMMGGSPAFDFLELRPADALTTSRAVPQILAHMPAVSDHGVDKTRRFDLHMSGMGMFAKFTINGRTMKMSRINEVVEKGVAEIWEVSNSSVMPHPFHIHNTQFCILDRNGAAPTGGERELKDTVLVNPRDRVRILIRFDHYTDAEHPYMYHCHILEHEDAGMMGQFTVV